MESSETSVAPRVSMRRRLPFTGWLNAIQFVLGISTFATALRLFTGFDDYFTEGAASAPNSTFAIADFTISLLLNVLATAALVILMGRRSPLFPRLFAVWCVLQILVALIDWAILGIPAFGTWLGLSVADYEPIPWFQTAVPVVVSFLCLAYVLRSRKVAEIFSD